MGFLSLVSLVVSSVLAIGRQIRIADEDLLAFIGTRRR
jgi:hypothetical protein